MEVLVAELLFIVAGVIAGVQKAWAICAAAAGLAFVYAGEVFKQLDGKG